MSTKAVKKLVSLLAVLALVFSMLSVGVVSAETGESSEVKNVILLIGDGMGYNHWELCKQLSGEVELFVENGLEYYGFSRTRSYSHEVTDSAAGGTALATGIKTDNRAAGFFPDTFFAAKRAPKTLSELAIELGMKTGIVTSDNNSGATPAAFSAHVKDRRMYVNIAKQQLTCGIDLIWTDAGDTITEKKLEGTEYVLVKDWDDLRALEDGQKSFGQFDTSVWKRANEDNCPTLSDLTEEAIKRLDNNDGEGFFLMVEGAHVDKHSHDMNAEDMTEAMLEFDIAIEAAVDFAKEDGNTIVIVTADHETGNITLIDGKYQYTQGEHSATDVPVCVYGTDELIAEGETIENTDIALFIADAIGAEEGQFPGEIQTTTFRFYIKDIIGVIGVQFEELFSSIGAWFKNLSK